MPNKKTQKTDVFGFSERRKLKYNYCRNNTHFLDLERSSKGKDPAMRRIHHTFLQEISFLVVYIVIHLFGEVSKYRYFGLFLFRRLDNSRDLLWMSTGVD